MTTIALHKYHEQIDKLLNDSHYDLAVEHCRHILQQHPQHIATYRLLAKALLEKNDYAGATELFQRILSADPNDYIAHAGLAVIYKEEDVVSQAIWHLERAYEIEPYNAAIQHELRSLYVHQAENSRRGKQNDDTAVPNASLPLSAGALARFYLRSQLYDQSAALLRATLEKDQERIDLRVLLMEALWRDGRRIEAVNVCLQVLDQLPNCIAANAIIAEIWLRTGRVDEAQRYLQHLQTMLLFDKRHIDRESPEGSAFH
ncbi:MAG: tetratricopeptide repeat protein, partial [Candidatus Promineifilaceae bacterium]